MAAMFGFVTFSTGRRMPRAADPASLLAAAAEEEEPEEEDDDFPPLDKVVPSAATTGP